MEHPAFCSLASCNYAVATLFSEMKMEYAKPWYIVLALSAECLPYTSCRNTTHTKNTVPAMTPVASGLSSQT